MVVPSGKPIAFDYSAYDGQGTLYIAIKIYDLSSGVATLYATQGMTHIYGGSYWTAYTFPPTTSGKNFLIQKSVYTDLGFTTLNANYAPGSDIVEIDGFDGNNGRAS